MTEITNPDGNKEKEKKVASITLAKGLCKKPHIEKNGGDLNYQGESHSRGQSTAIEKMSSRVTIDTTVQSKEIQSAPVLPDWLILQETARPYAI